jgi:4-hydroxy 2-oxovalerate aldolase
MVKVMDVTLRDGSNDIDFRFTAEQTAGIVAGLQAAGVPYIEFGHGMGLQASEKTDKKAAATDREYIEAAMSVVKDAKVGCFAAPKWVGPQDIDMLSEHGVHFVRIGTDVDKAKSAESLIRYAKKKGLEVHFSFMKAYAMDVSELASQVAAVASFGADIIHLMDSAGHMLPTEVDAYITHLKGTVDVPIGFHAHDNLSLSVANAIAAVNAGADSVDASLRGLGRSGGNAQIEALIPAFDRCGIETGIDMLSLMGVGEEYVVPLMEKRARLNPLDIVYGFAGFHSSFIGIIREVAADQGLDVDRLVMAVSRREQINVTKELVEEVARGLNSRD